MPIKNARYRFRMINKMHRQRLAFKNQVVEVTGYRKRNGRWIKAYNRKFPRKTKRRKR